MIFIRNFSILWTYFISLTSKLFTDLLSGQIYILIIGFPLVIIFSTIYTMLKSINYMITSNNFGDSEECLARLNYFKTLIESFIITNESKNRGNIKIGEPKKHDILLKGYIEVEEETCNNSECPLKRFKNSNAYNIQKHCLLNYMGILYTDAIKK